MRKILLFLFLLGGFAYGQTIRPYVLADTCKVVDTIHTNYDTAKIVKTKVGWLGNYIHAYLDTVFVSSNIMGKSTGLTINTPVGSPNGGSISITPGSCATNGASGNLYLLTSYTYDTTQYSGGVVIYTGNTYAFQSRTGDILNNTGNSTGNYSPTGGNEVVTGNTEGSYSPSGVITISTGSTKGIISDVGYIWLRTTNADSSYSGDIKMQTGVGKLGSGKFDFKTNGGLELYSDSAVNFNIGNIYFNDTINLQAHDINVLVNSTGSLNVDGHINGYHNISVGDTLLFATGGQVIPFQDTAQYSILAANADTATILKQLTVTGYVSNNDSVYVQTVNDFYIEFNTGAVNDSLIMLDPSTCTGKIIVVKKVSGSADIKFSRDIDGIEYSITGLGDAIQLLATPTKWVIIGSYISLH